MGFEELKDSERPEREARPSLEGYPSSSSNPDTWTWNEELQRFYHTPALEDPRLQDTGPGIPPTAKSTHFGTDGWSLPGQGRAYPTCGDPIVYLCTKCEGWTLGHQNCRRATCPTCYHTWAWLQARRATLRIEKARKVFARELGRWRRPVHVMISLPRSAWDMFENDYPKARRKAYKLLKKAGVKGGALISHPWRQKCALCGGDIIGKWGTDKETGKPEVKEARCVDCGSDRFYWADGPHFHVPCYGWVVGTKEIEEATGYVIKNIGLIDNLGGTIWYQLTHCGIREGRQIVTYFGICAYNKYTSPPLPRPPMLCLECGAFMVLYKPGHRPGKPPPGRSR